MFDSPNGCEAVPHKAADDDAADSEGRSDTVCVTDMCMDMCV